VHCVITVDNDLHYTIKCSIHQIMSRLQTSEGIGRACGLHGKFQKLCKSEKLNGRESSTYIIVQNSVEKISWAAWT